MSHIWFGCILSLWMSQLYYLCELFSVSVSQSYLMSLRYIMFSVFENVIFIIIVKLSNEGMYMLYDIYIPSLYYTVIILSCKVLRNVRYTLIHKIYTLWQNLVSWIYTELRNIKYIRSCILSPTKITKIGDSIFSN